MASEEKISKIRGSPAHRRTRNILFSECESENKMVDTCGVRKPGEERKCGKMGEKTRLNRETQRRETLDTSEIQVGVVKKKKM